jgi:transcriptional regulator
MHPNPAFRSEDRDLFEALIDEIGFGMVFGQTPDGPRVVHTPLLSTGDGAVQFHIARGNALTRHLDGMTALAVVNGPDAYVSPRWYADQTRVPTWNYLTLELEGRVRRMDEDGLLALLEAVSDRHEARITAGTFWKIDKVPEAKLRGMLNAIVGFELEVHAWRPTLKLGQKDTQADRDGAIAGLEAQGSLAIARLMRDLSN